MDITFFRSMARDAFRWTRRTVKTAARNTVAMVPLSTIMLGAVLVHPERRKVFPFDPKKDGAKKNDREAASGRRALRRPVPEADRVGGQAGRLSTGRVASKRITRPFGFRAETRQPERGVQGRGRRRGFGRGGPWP